MASKRKIVKVLLSDEQLGYIKRMQSAVKNLSKAAAIRSCVDAAAISLGWKESEKVGSGSDGTYL